MYTYAATVLRVVDGDTISLDVDLGFSAHMHVTVRLLGCNAIELSQPGGPEARDHLRTVLPVGSLVTISTVKVDKYGGRFLATVTLPDGSDLVSSLIAAQWAAAWDGIGPRPVPPWPRTVTP
jgi:micrococcal nuclease